MKLQQKLLLPIALLILLLVGATGTLSYRAAEKGLTDSLLGNMSGESRSILRSINDTIAGGTLDIQRIAAGDLVQNFLRGDFKNPEEQKKASERFLIISDSYKHLMRVSLLDTNGVVIASSVASSLGSGENAGADFFLAALKGSPSIGSPYKSTRTGHGVMAIASPVTVDGKIMGVIFATLDLDSLFERFVAPSKINKTGYAYVAYKNGQIIMHKNKDELAFNDNIPIKSTLQKFSQQESGVSEFESAAGVPCFVYFMTDKNIGFTVVIQDEISDAFATLNDIRWASIVSAVVAVLLGALVVFLIVRPIVSALQQGVRFAGEIATGKLDGELKVSRKDEIGTLADALRTIPEALKNIIDEYAALEKHIEEGRLDSKGDGSRFSGDFARLVNGTNAIVDRFRMVLNSMPSPVAVYDTTGGCIFLNTAGRTTTKEDYQGKTYSMLFAAEDGSDPRNALRRALEGGTTASAETRANPNGKAMDIGYSAIPIRSASGVIVAVLQLITDLTEIKTTQRTILEVAGQATDISNRMAAASEQLSAQVEQVGHGAEVQRERVSSTATAMEEMNATVMEVARNAEQARVQVESTREKAENGTSLVGKVIAAINQVNTVALDMQAHMEELGKQAESIGGVMNVISDIADQTNLLALNAAIEAARAGEAGRGFAVVADEVRKLAEKTMGATTEVGSNIQGIQQATRSNIQSMDNAAKQAGEAAALAATSGTALEEIRALVAANQSLIAGIATAAEEQSATSEEINSSVEEINTIAGETATGMEQSTSAVSEVARMAQELRALLSRLQG